MTKEKITIIYTLKYRKTTIVLSRNKVEKERAKHH